jgi:AraC family transcriptional regulator, regulatory protein of adaptative response / DNA-3-methyladenine glycosylase II
MDDGQRYAAASSRDARFDGVFFTAVKTTGIYCRPSCPAITPKRANVVFYPTAAAAQQAGFRACKRCRPDASPGSPEWNVRSDVAGRAMRLIADGVVDRAGIDGLADRLGYSPRQVGRLLSAEVGAGPLALARAQRARTARILVETTALPMGDVAFAAGFSSIRQFNATMLEVYDIAPTALRERAGPVTATRRRAAPGVAGDASATGVLRLRLPYRPPIDVERMFGFLAARAIPGVEVAAPGEYRRTIRLPNGCGLLWLRHVPTASWVDCSLVLSDLRDVTAAVQRSTWTPTPWRSPVSSTATRCSGRSPRNARAGARSARSTATRSRSGPCSASRYRWPPRGGSPGGSRRCTARRFLRAFPGLATG